MALIDIAREPVYYTADFSGMDVEQAPHYLQALAFDGEDNTYGARLISRLNNELVQAYPQYNLPPTATEQFPQRIIIINTVNDELPLAYETRRIWEAQLHKDGKSCFTRIVNSRKTLLKELQTETEHTLVFSQCGSAEVYDAGLCHLLMESKVVIIPGSISAPGGTLDKLSYIEPPPACTNNFSIMAHYRLGTKGIVLETAYAQTLQKPEKLLPLTSSMLEAIGGEAGLQNMILKAATELMKLTEHSGNRPPWRFQVGFANNSIVELQGDAARGLCSSTRWSDFIAHSLAWLEDGIAYYNRQPGISA